MTPKQRAEHTETLQRLIKSAGFKLNRYGAYERSLNSRDYRIKFKKVNLRIEAKTTAGWVNLNSAPISQITPVELTSFLGRFFKADSQAQNVKPIKDVKPVKSDTSRPASKKHDFQVSIIWTRSDGLRFFDVYYIQAYSGDLAERHGLDRLRKDNDIHNPDVESISAYSIKNGTRLVARSLPMKL